MKRNSIILGILAVFVTLLLVTSVIAQQKKKRPKRASGTVGLIDTEKNYMVIVTRKGKLITVEFTDKTKITKLVPQKAKIGDIRLKARSTITYESKGDKKILKAIKFEGRAKRRKK